MVSNRSQSWLFVGFTAVMLGYAAVWLPYPQAALRLTGHEMAEWVKFLPSVRLGYVPVNHDWFYLPVITLGVMMALATASWSNRRWQTWVFRGVGLLISLLAFPPIIMIRNEILPTAESGGVGKLMVLLSVPRIQWVLLVLIVGLLVVGLGRLPAVWHWVALGVTAGVGIVLPTRAYYVLRPIIVATVQSEVGYGVGVWLNIFGHGVVCLVCAVALLKLTAKPQ